MLTVPALLQLYAPLAGLLAVVFWLGVLSQRVRQLENIAKDDRSSSERLVRVETKMEAFKEDLTGINANLTGINRQLANIAQKGLEFRPGV